MGSWRPAIIILLQALPSLGLHGAHILQAAPPVARPVILLQETPDESLHARNHASHNRRRIDWSVGEVRDQITWRH